jgi:hypothetical protein
MNVLRPGSIGPEVSRWQNFLIGQGFYKGISDANFGEQTTAATVAFQQRYALKPFDGIVGRLTLSKAIELGYGEIHDEAEEEGTNWPPRPNFVSPNQASRDQMFGRFKYTHTPREGNPERITILDGWDKVNLASFDVPQLREVRGAPSDCKVVCHKKVGPRVQSLFRQWEIAGLLPLVLTWGGSYTPRFMRGSTTSLSSHAHASAFDINMQWNALGAEPALVSKEGSVRRLVQLANAGGFFWGGHYKGRPDGMHFEIAKLV